MNKIIFGTDGWRGLIGEEVNEKSISEAGQAFSHYLLNRYIPNDIKIAVGFDGRKFSEFYANIFAEVLSGNNIDVLLSDRIIPTPVLSFIVKHKNLNAGVMITASHNPSIYSGIKFKDSYGGPFFTEETLKVEQHLHRTSVKKSRDKITVDDFLTPYRVQLDKLIDFNIIRDSGINIIIDSMSGAGQKIIQSIFQSHNIPSETIFGDAFPDFSGRQAEPLEKNLAPLSGKLRSGEYSLGIATDGDADRLGIMLENGVWLNAQETILLISDYLCRVKNIQGDIVKTSSVTDKLRVFENEERKVHDVQVGFKYICEEMLEKNVVFGCEESGGFGYGFHIPERDGIFSGILLCEILASSGFKKLSSLTEQLKDKYGVIHYSRKDIKYEDKNRINILPAIFKNPPSFISGFNVRNISEFFSSRGIINGLKFYLEGKSRWLLIRASETEPLIRIYSEAENSQEVKDILEEGLKLIGIYQNV